MFLAENGCELTFSLGRLVLLSVVAVGDAVPFSPDRTAGWPAGHRVVVPRGGHWSLCGRLGVGWGCARSAHSSLTVWRCVGRQPGCGCRGRPPFDGATPLDFPCVGRFSDIAFVFASNELGLPRKVLLKKKKHHGVV